MPPGSASVGPASGRINRRIGAYILPGDPVWLASSLSRYYPLLDDLVVVAPRSRRGWTGLAIPVDECIGIVEGLDTRGIRRIVWGEWENHQQPMRADTAQQQAGIDALGGTVDWVLQIDNDEILPDPTVLVGLLDWADERSVGAVEWPMRVLFRQLRNGDFLEVCAADGTPRYDYPGPIAVRAGSSVVDARRCAGAFLRPVVHGDHSSLQLAQPPGKDEIRLEALAHRDAIVHNSWGRERSAVHRITRTWGHASGLRSERYFWSTWWPAPFNWRMMRDFHPFARGLWPRLRRTSDIAGLLVPADR